MSVCPTVTIPADPRTGVLRELSNMIRLHGLCARVPCRRARACRGEPRDCLQRYAPLVPEEAREGAKRMIDGWRQDLSFDELIEQEDVLDQVMALAEWAARVEASYPARAVPPKRNDPPGDVPHRVVPQQRSTSPATPAGDLPQTAHSARLRRTPGPRIRSL